MKHCTNCGKEFGEGSLFCDICGLKLTEIANPAAVPASEIADKPVAEGVPETAAEVVEETIEETVPNPSKLVVETEKPQTKLTKIYKKLGKKAIAIILAAAILLGTVTAGFLTEWFGLAGGPLGKLMSAVRKTVAAGSMTIKITETIDSDSQTYSFRVNVDTKKKSFKVLGGEKGDDSLHYITEEHCYYTGNDFYKDKDEMDTDFIKSAFDVYNAVFKKKNADWDDVVENMYLEDYVKDDEVQDFLKTLRKDYLNDKEWLEDELGFEKKSSGGVTTYSFEVKWKDLFKELAKIADDSDAVRKDGVTILKDLAEDWQEDEGFALSIDVKGGKVIGATLELDEGDWSKEYEIEITDIGKSKISNDEIEEITDDVENWYVAHTCPECNTLMEVDPSHDDICYSCMTKCDMCSNYARDKYSYYSYYYGYMSICENCYKHYVN